MVDLADGLTPLDALDWMFIDDCRKIHPLSPRIAQDCPHPTDEVLLSTRMLSILQQNSDRSLGLEVSEVIHNAWSGIEHIQLK